MKAIVAVNNHNHIGLEGQLPWKCKEDFKHFKNLTMGAELIVGSTTFEQCLGGKQLPGRTMHVVGKGYNTPFQAMHFALMSTIVKNNHIWVIGGKAIYNIFLPFCSELHISHINNDTFGDTGFNITPGFRGKIIHYYFEEDK